jgi:hypothetical protein
VARDLFTSSSAAVAGIWRHRRHASFDKLRMRKIENGISTMPRRKNLILSLSKDAPAGLPRGEAA